MAPRSHKRQVLRDPVCARIVEARKEAGLTQKEMAERLGVDPRSYQNYEKDRIPHDHMSQIAEISGKSEEWLRHGTDAVPALLRESVQQRQMLELILEAIRPGWRELLRPPEGLETPHIDEPSNGRDPAESEQD